MTADDRGREFGSAPGGPPDDIWVAEAPPVADLWASPPPAEWDYGVVTAHSQVPPVPEARPMAPSPVPPEPVPPVAPPQRVPTRPVSQGGRRRAESVEYAPQAGHAPQAEGVAVMCRGLVYIYRLEGYDVVALAGVDLDIVAGESVALVGPSGSGKSTLLSLMAGLIPPAAGRLLVGPYDLAKVSPADLQRMRARDVGVILQGADRNLLPYLSAEQNIRFAQRGVPRDRRAGLHGARDILGLVGLGDRRFRRSRPRDLTPGQRQRLALAVAVGGNPGLLLADEPTSQLDTDARDDVLEALEYVRRAGTTVVVVTHDPEVGVRMGRTVTIRDGRVGAEGRSGEDYAVIGRDGGLHLPPEVLRLYAPGTLVRVELQPDHTVRLTPADETRGM